ncbi:MAG TPA: pinensin family lanthipeptide [Saprospiraceae bacterium]|nr:pinensin family lanthipeptide [Saprospiraceae bacterium]HPI07456.1 pinensin family lanthipeptide [Saprospiraceae bacterium]
MAKEKLTLDELKVQSLVTSLEGPAMNQVKGGTAPMRGKFFTYRTRWTAVDVRSDFQGAPSISLPGDK